jgi:hypothetical protein
MAPRQPFSQGPRLTGGPSGDPAAQAIASLRGYAYQLYASGLAWLDLKPGEELYLEVAQDYSVAAADALRAVQVKDTSANVTINSEDIRDALDAFVDLVARNPGREIHLHFLSTCSVGQEQRREHRAGGEPTLLYWRRAAAAADVQPVRQVLGKIKLSDRVRAFIDARDDETLRREFLRRIHWDCGQQPIDGVLRELENGLLRYFVERFRSSVRREQLTAAVLHRVLLTIIQSDNRRLVDADLLALVVDTANVLVSRPDFETAIQGIGARMADEGTSIESIELSRLLEPEQDLPLPPILAERKAVTLGLLAGVRLTGIGFVTGSTGCGKTIVARLTARAHGSGWSVLDLRDASAEQIVQRLDLALGALSPSGSAGIILDDFNEIEDPQARRALSRFVSTLRRRDILCLITAYRKPSSRSFSELGVDESTHHAVHDLAESEVAAMVSASGGDADKWTTAVLRASVFGHPQLVQAVISGLRARGWPDDEIESLRTFNPTSDIEAERLVARNRLVAVLPEESRILLYRTSLLFGRFDRPLALAVGAIDPSVPEPGAHLDQLIGPWIELTAQRDMRVSPLLQNAGNEILTPNDTKRVHQTAAEKILGGRTLAVDKANSGFLHALLGESEWLLTRLAHNITTTTVERRRQLSDWMASLRLHRLDRAIVLNSPVASILLRLAQFLLIAPTGKPNAIRSCWRALQAELAELEDVEARGYLEYMVLAKALFSQEAMSFLPDGVGLILRFEELSRRDPGWRDILNQRTPSPDGRRTHGMLGTLFITYALRMPSVTDLQRAFDSLDATSDTLRGALLGDVFDMPSDFSLVVNHAWLEESKREKPDWPTFAEAYRTMAAQAQNWGYRELSLRCFVARSVILDEYLNTPTAALQALDDAKQVLGDNPVLDRARAKILYRRKDHEAALRLLRVTADKLELNDPIARTYMLREAGISAAELDQWAEARQWFAAARETASRATSASMGLMAIGLRADEALAAYKAGDMPAALTGLDSTLDELAPIDPVSSIAAGYRHRVVRHSILWLFGQATETAVGVGDQLTAFVPGMCSNPEPTDLSDLPLGSMAYARYLLVQAEIAAGVSAGIESGLRAHLDGRAIPNMEMLVRGTRVEYCVRRLNATGLIAALPSWVDSQIYLDANRETVRQGDPGNPVYGEIVPATSEQLKGERAIFTANDALLAFGIIAALEGQSEALASLCARAGEIRGGYAGKEILNTMGSGQTSEERLPPYVAVQVHRVIHNEVLTPDELFTAGVRFVQWAKTSNLQKVLGPALERWARERWVHVIEHQTFNFRNPATSVPPIRDVLASTESGLKFLGRLFVAAEPGVRTKFDQVFREYLLTL